MKPINTVLGSLALKDLGFTLMHEHLLLSDWDLRMADPQFFDQEQAMQMIEEVIADAKTHGVKTLVDVTPVSYTHLPAVLLSCLVLSPLLFYWVIFVLNEYGCYMNKIRSWHFIISWPITIS